MLIKEREDVLWRVTDCFLEVTFKLKAEERVGDKGAKNN